MLGCVLTNQILGEIAREEEGEALRSHHIAHSGKSQLTFSTRPWDALEAVLALSGYSVVLLMTQMCCDSSTREHSLGHAPAVAGW